MGKKFFVPLFFISLFLYSQSIEAVFAATLSFDPTSANAKAGDNVSIKVNINAGTEQIVAADSVVTYDPASLQVVSTVNGNYFPQFESDSEEEGTLYLFALTDDVNVTKTGSGTLGTIVFKARKQGTVNLVFLCEDGSTEESNIIKNDEDASDIISCSQNGRSVVTISAAQSSPTATRAPSPTPTATIKLSPSLTPANSVSTTPSPTGVVVPTHTLTPTPIVMPSLTPTPTIFLSPTPLPPTVTPYELPRTGGDLPPAVNTPEQNITSLPRSGSSQSLLFLIFCGFTMISFGTVIIKKSK